ncbi:MAG: hypothetical protein JRF33_21805 [Deltaproteobacteria bacterium]|nr:hypothetical protein [Deltaproteobacteria bacterium]
MRGFHCLAMFFGLLLVAGPAAAEKKSAAMVVADGALKSVVRVKLTMSGYQVLDAWREHDFFHGLSSLRTGHIDAPKPGFLPEALVPDWEKGIAACQARAGKPPYGVRNTVAFLCGQELAEVMWQRWLDQSGVDLVMIVSTASAKVTEKDLKALRAGKFDPKKMKKKLRIAVFAPQESSMRYLESDLPAQQDLPKKVSDQIKELLEGKGLTKARQISRELPKSGFASATGGLSDELKQGKPLDLKPVALPKDCKAQLPALEISPAKAPLAITIMRQWKKSMPGRHPAEKTLECTLALTMSKPLFGSELRSMGAILRCGDLQVSANRPGIKPSDGHRGLSKKLVSSLLRKLCK